LVVGDIPADHDPGDFPATLVEDDGTWTLAGDVHVDVVERAVGLDLPRGDHETIGGLVIAAHGSLPAAGTSVVVLLPDDPGELAHAGEPDPVWMRVDVLTIERHVPALVRVTVPADPPPTEDERAAAITRDQEEDR
jgi:CBS domain containing-hemolysin-like protein